MITAFVFLLMGSRLDALWRLIQTRKRSMAWGSTRGLLTTPHLFLCDTKETGSQDYLAALFDFSNAFS